METSHFSCPRRAWCVVNILYKNGLSPLISTNCTICYSILYCNSPALYIRLKYVYSVISVIVDWLPGNNKTWTINKFVAFGVRYFLGPRLAWYDDCSNWFDKSTWQVITCQVNWRGARGQGDKSKCQVNLSSWLVCQAELVNASGLWYLRKKLAGVRRQIFFENR